MLGEPNIMHRASPPTSMLTEVLPPKSMIIIAFTLMRALMSILEKFQWSIFSFFSSITNTKELSN